MGSQELRGGAVRLNEVASTLEHFLQNKQEPESEAQTLNRLNNQFNHLRMKDDTLY